MARDPISPAARAAVDADASVAKAVAAKAKQPLLERIADVGDQPQLRTLAIAASAAGLAAGRRSGFGPRLARAGVRMLVAHELATFAKNFVKRRIERTRPRSLEAGAAGAHLPRRGGNRAKERTSFPSGHTAGSAAVAMAFGREFPQHRAKALGAAATLALVQLPRGAHYPGDVAAGAAIGLAAEAALAAFWPRSPLLLSMEPLPCVTC
jgi:membrane-associated phospholipid phosphatase